MKVTVLNPLSPAALAGLHRRQDDAIQAARTERPPDVEGAGIVMVAGGGRYFTNAYVALSILRHVVGCRLPIQIWHLGAAELSPVMRRLLRRFDVEFVDAVAVRRRFPMRRLGGWECKVFAILHAPFRHVLLLDADNAPLIDPASLFDLPEYAATGAVFWPDNQVHPENSPVWEIFRTPYRREQEVESGQVLIDKQRCWVPLRLAQHLSAWSDIYDQYIYGDKETFHFAWRQLGQEYAMPSRQPRILACHKETPAGPRRMTGALEQHDFSGRPVFHHRTGAKWTLYGDTPRTDAQEIEAHGRTVLDELRRNWDGRVRPDPPVTPFARNGLIRTRDCLYRRIGDEERRLRFDSNGCILEGSFQERRWRLEPAGSGRGLVISGDEGDTCRLEEGDDGVWRGTRLWYERGPVELLPLTPEIDPA